MAEHLVRRLPAQEVREPVGTDEEDRIPPALTRPADGVVRVRRLRAVEVDPRDLGPRQLGEGGLDEPQARLRIRERLYGLERGPPARSDHEPLEPEVVERRTGESEVPVVRRVERAAEEPGHASSNTSSPISTSAPVFAPAARNASSSSSPSGAVPVIRKPRSVRRI